jgi:hypothetical protein
MIAMKFTIELDIRALLPFRRPLGRLRRSRTTRTPSTMRYAAPATLIAVNTGSDSATIRADSCGDYRHLHSEPSRVSNDSPPYAVA